MSYSTRFTSRILGGPSVDTRVDYHSEDPHALHFEFDHDDGHIVQWRFGRDLTVQGLCSPSFVGEGDVRLRRSSGISGGEMDNDRLEDVEHIELCLSTPSGLAVVLMPLNDLSRFVGRTLVETPLGDELMGEAVFAALVR